jgi:PAS domain S-box-containing protein
LGVRVEGSGWLRQILAGGGPVGRLIAGLDWPAHGLPPLDDWPPELATLVGTMLRSGVAMTLLWGEEGRLIYNAGYAAICGPRHPGALGGAVLDIWPEAADFNARVLRRCLAGETLTYRRLPLTLERHGLPEPVWLNLDYAPVFGRDGRPAGILAIVNEVTAAVEVERRYAEEKAQLAASEARFRSVFDADLMGLTLFDVRSGKTVAINDHFLRMTGHSRADFDEGRWDWSTFTPPEDHPLDERAIAQARQRGFWTPYEKRYRRPDGAAIVVRVASAALPSEPDCLVVAVQDISGQREAEAALRASEARFRQLADAMPQLVWTAQADGMVDYYNARHRQYAGLSRDRSGAWEWAPVVHPDDAAATAVAWQSALATGHAYTCEHRLLMADGSVRWHVSRAEPVRGATGAVERWFGTATDIDALKTSQADLRALNVALNERVAEALKGRKLLADLIEASQAFVVVLDLGHRVLAINPAAREEAQRLFGIRPTVGDHFLELIGDSVRRERVRATWDRVLRGEAFAMTFETHDLDGNLVVQDLRFDVLRDGAGKPIGAYQFAVDITERVRDQQRLAEAEAALRQSQKMEALGQLTGGVAHDFNNLLTPIVGALDLIGRRLGDDQRAQRLIGGALQSADRARTLVQRLLAFSRRQTLEARAVDGQALINGMADLLARSLGPSIELVFRLAIDAPPLHVDPNQCELALLNLAVNARDAMPDGGRLEIALAPGEPPPSLGLPAGRYVRLAVVDTGAGMDAETLARAIDPFFTTKDKGRGTGLGLSMVHGLAAQSHGAFELLSRPGEGTCAILWLPAAAEPAAAPVAPTDDAWIVPARGARLLLVDDEDLVRSGTVEMLRDAGFTVVDAGSPLVARQMLRDGLPIDALITDFAMPDMNGIELIAEARSILPALPALLVTGFASVSCEDTPHIARLAKPFRQIDIVRALSMLLADARTPG